MAALATVALIIVTWIYVRLTGRLARSTHAQLEEAIRARLDAQMPTVVFNLSPFFHHGPTVEVHVTAKNLSAEKVALVHLEAPRKWSAVPLADPSGEHFLQHFLVVAPQAGSTVEYYAPVDVQSSESPDSRVQTLEGVVEVMPISEGVRDRYFWFVHFDRVSGSFERTISPRWDQRIYDHETLTASPRQPKRAWPRRHKSTATA